MRRRTVAALGAAAVAAVAVVVATAAASGSSGGTETPPTTIDPQRLTTVERRDLTRETTFDGTVSRGTATPLTLAGQGTLTGLPSVGAVVQPGQQLAEVDGEPVVLLRGDRPAWRDLRSGIDDGADVRQLEQALTDLGYASDDLSIDDEWTSATTAAVKAFQEAGGLDDDGQLALGEIVFAPGAVRVASVDGNVGQDVGAAGIEVTGETQVVLADADVGDADVLEQGTAVTVTLPSGRALDGTVYAVGEPVTAGDGSTSLPVVVAVPDLDAIDGLSVEVALTTVEVPGATAVPAEALLALAEGGYALEVPDPSSPTGTRLVGVELGTFDDEGWVEVRGEVQVGDQVVVP